MFVTILKPPYKVKKKYNFYRTILKSMNKRKEDILFIVMSKRGT